MKLRNKQKKASSKPLSKPKKKKKKTIVLAELLSRHKFTFFSHYLEKKPRRITHGQEDIGVLGQF